MFERRFIIFISLFILFTLVERRYPFRNPKRFSFTNLLLLSEGSLLAFVILPLGLSGFAEWIQGHHFGLFNLFKINTVIEFIITLFILDLGIYFQHRLFHRIPWLWKFHQVHHCDPIFDTSTGVRFHPGEILFSIIIKLIFIAFLGLNPLAVITFEILLNAFSLFNHMNIAIPEKINLWLQRFIVTSNFHRSHHHSETLSMNANYGFMLSLWDYLFKTYRPIPLQQQQTFHIGLKSNPPQSLFALNTLPFKTDKITLEK